MRRRTLNMIKNAKVEKSDGIDIESIHAKIRNVCDWAGSLIEQNKGLYKAERVKDLERHLLSFVPQISFEPLPQANLPTLSADDDSDIQQTPTVIATVPEKKDG